ncbi:C-type natriuretic peptide 4 [Carassius auratus]|uniref:C-type natriuretic peptide 4 n=1 Tax=Carassius auratus TaxID=7957 RepID=A0A6P6J3M2_CARAU|nr:C-type natriuretic peptide 4-like [Carassius auratus]XP_052445494.1 C-type natriuretic peptide 4 [Carassius gibelio]
MIIISHLVACGLILTLLSVSTETKPLTPEEQRSLRMLLGEELSELLGSAESRRRMEDRVRLLRDLRLDTRAKGPWARMMNDQPGSRRLKAGSKKGGSTARSGCFGHKMDRIGTMSGMGCQPSQPANNLS